MKSMFLQVIDLTLSEKVLTVQHAHIKIYNKSSYPLFIKFGSTTILKIEGGSEQTFYNLMQTLTKDFRNKVIYNLTFYSLSTGLDFTYTNFGEL